MASLFRTKEYQSHLDSGAPNNGGKLLWSLTTTTTAKSTYPTEADALAGTNANVNPIILDSDGRSPVEVWIVGRYRLRTYTSADVLIADDDPIEDTVSASTAQQQAQGWGGNNSGTANALVFTYSPAITSYVAGTPLRGRILADNTTAVTVNAGAGVKSLVKRDGAALVSGDLQGPDIIEFVYDSTSDVMRLLTPDGLVDIGGAQTITGSKTFTGATVFTGTVRGGVSVILAAGGGLTAPADTAENTLATVTIPAGAMGVNGMVRITSMWGCNNDASGKTPRIKFGGTTIETYSLIGATGAALYADVGNKNNASAQIARGVHADTTNMVETLTTLAINTTSSTTVVFTAQKADGTDTITLDHYTVELLASA